MKETDIAYIAGVMDGEGCFRLEKFKTDRSPIGFQYRTTAELAMCDKSTIEFVSQRTNRHIQIKKIKSGRTLYLIIWRNSFAASFMRLLLPYLIGKKEQVKLCLHFEDNITPGRGRSYAQSDAILCENVFLKLKELKRPHILSC